MKQSFGLLMYRINAGHQEFLLVHPGGPFFKSKDVGIWSIPKGEGMHDEEPLLTAIREFQEETGYRPLGDFIELDPITQRGGKKVFCWAIKSEFDVQTLKSNTFLLEWPPRSGRMITIPEVDKAGWFKIEDARIFINERQVPLLEQAAGFL